MKIYYSEWLRCQPNEQGIGISFLLAFQPLVRLALSKKSRFSMISVPFSCRYYLFSGWQHVGKPIKNQYPGAWSWVVIHLFKTLKEWGGQLSVSHVKLQGKDSLSALKTSQMWHEKQLTKGKEGSEETEMSKQKTAIVPILHSKILYTGWQLPRRWSTHMYAKRFYPRPMRSRFIFEDWFVGLFVDIVSRVFLPFR